MKFNKKHLLLLLCFLLLLAGCGSGFLYNKLLDECVKIDETQHFIYNSFEEKELYNDDAEHALQRLEDFLAEVAEKNVWDIPEEKIKYFKFEFREQIKKLTGWQVTGRADFDQNFVVSIYYSDAHEVAHLFTTHHLIKEKGRVDVANFWLEGIAMYYTWPRVYFGEDPTEDGKEVIQTSIGVIEGKSVHENVRLLEEIPDTETMKTFIYGNEHFDALDTKTGYSIAGSFVSFLIGQGIPDCINHNPNNLQKYKELLSKLNYCSSRNDVLDAFYEVYEVDFDDMVDEWLDFISTWEEDQIN